MWAGGAAEPLPVWGWARLASPPQPWSAAAWTQSPSLIWRSWILPPPRGIPSVSWPQLLSLVILAFFSHPRFAHQVSHQEVSEEGPWVSLTFSALGPTQVLHLRLMGPGVSGGAVPEPALPSAPMPSPVPAWWPPLHAGGQLVAGRVPAVVSWGRGGEGWSILSCLMAASLSPGSSSQLLHPGGHHL